MYVSVYLSTVSPQVQQQRTDFPIPLSYPPPLFHFFFIMYTAPDPVTDGCEPPCGCWDLNSGPLEEQSVFLTTEPSLQPCSYILYAPSYEMFPESWVKGKTEWGGIGISSRAEHSQLFSQWGHFLELEAYFVT